MEKRKCENSMVGHSLLWKYFRLNSWVYFSIYVTQFWIYLEICHKMFGVISKYIYKCLERLLNMLQLFGDCFEICHKMFGDILKSVTKYLEIFWNISQNVCRYFEICRKIFEDIFKHVTKLWKLKLCRFGSSS